MNATAALVRNWCDTCAIWMVFYYCLALILLRHKEHYCKFIIVLCIVLSEVPKIKSKNR